uniref:(northern house mosquito) hypothetical protein n=1 Tax=Culex pipiens TaxID=7175 RepID=A0A8D8GVS4_CULPI
MEWVVKKYKINKQTTYLLLYYQEINMVHKQKKNKEKMRKKKLLLHGKSKTNLLTLTNKQTKNHQNTYTFTTNKKKTKNSECGHQRWPTPAPSFLSQHTFTLNSQTHRKP